MITRETYENPTPAGTQAPPTNTGGRSSRATRLRWVECSTSSAKRAERGVSISNTTLGLPRRHSAKKSHLTVSEHRNRHDAAVPDPQYCVVRLQSTKEGRSMAGVIEREDGTRIHGPGKLSAERLQHELALRRRANRIPGRVTTTERAVAANNAAQPRRRGDGHAPSQFRLGNRKPRRYGVRMLSTTRAWWRPLRRS